MLVRLRDFAEIHRITERTVQVHIKENWDVLEGHIDRRGKQGTWLDDFAQEFLLEKIQLPSKDEVLVPSAREAALLIQVAELSQKLADAERRASLNAESAGKVMFLEAQSESQGAQITDLTMKLGEMGQKLTEANNRTQSVQEASERALKASDEEWARRLAEAQERAQDKHEEELSQVEAKFQSMGFIEFYRYKKSGKNK